MAATLTLASFRISYPDFSAASDTLVQSIIDSTNAECVHFRTEAVANLASGLLTAHRLSLMSGGEDMRLVAKGIPTSHYYLEYQNLCRKHFGGPYLAGTSIQQAAWRRLI
jgi:hypothetical protein